MVSRMTRIELPSAWMKRREAVSEQRKAQALLFGFGDPDPLVVVSEDGRAEVDLFGPIDPWFGVDAWQLAKELRAADVDEIVMRVDSPGGFVDDAILIYNSLVDHKADVEIIVESVAASAASLLVQAGDRRVMNRAAEMMVHAPWSWAAGDAAFLRETADWLDTQTERTAELYAARSGTSVQHWVEVMQGEQWYSAAEAVDAGLADEARKPKGPPAAKAQAELDLAKASAVAYGARYEGRAAAPDPSMPADAGEISTSCGAPDAPIDPEATASGIDGDERQRAEQVAATAIADAARARALAITTTNPQMRGTIPCRD